jgi:hypothetical protein
MIHVLLQLDIFLFARQFKPNVSLLLTNFWTKNLKAQYSYAYIWGLERLIFSMCLIKNHTMMMCGGMEVQGIHKRMVRFRKLIKNLFRTFFYYYFGLKAYWHCGQSRSIVPASGVSEDDCGEADGM